MCYGNIAFKIYHQQEGNELTVKQGQEKGAYISFLPPDSSNQLSKCCCELLGSPRRKQNKTKDMCICAVNTQPLLRTLRNRSRRIFQGRRKLRRTTWGLNQRESSWDISDFYIKEKGTNTFHSLPHVSGQTRMCNPGSTLPPTHLPAHFRTTVDPIKPRESECTGCPCT